MSRGRQEPRPVPLAPTDRARWLWLGPPRGAQNLAGWALLPLRAFLGFTFCFAGLQKLANSGFFNAANPASIQAQMAGAARRSPIHALITPLAHHAVLIGAVIAVGEIAVGVGALVGLLTRVAAIGGLLLSLNLFLAVSYHTSPYYTGSDIVFVFAWMPLIVAGGGQLSLDAVIANLLAARHLRPTSLPVQLPFATVQSICGHYHGGRCAAQHNAPCQPAGCPYLAREASRPVRGATAAKVDVDRRRLVGAVTLGVGVVAIIGTGAITGLARLLHGSSSDTSSDSGSQPSLDASVAASSPPVGTTSGLSLAAASADATSPSAGAASDAPTTAPTAHPTASATPKPAGSKIGAASSVKVKGSATFQDPATGDPAIVVQPRAGEFLGFDAVCPHAGCTVGYDEKFVRFVCPCHGSQFNGTTGAVEVGPASHGLGRITVAEGPDGQLYAR
jgi:thiosulfate dehydrogenase (quinone) large subunit